MSKNIFKISCVVFIIAGISIYLGGEVKYSILLKFFIKLLFLISGLFIILIWFLRRYYGDSASDEWIKKIFLFCATLFVLVLFGEYAVRYAFRDITTTGHYSYFSKKWLKDIHLNSLGVRDREVESKKAGIYRIAVIGDSLTFGQGIEEKDRFTNLLEAELKRTNNGYEVWNFGMVGAETVDEIKTLVNAIDKVDPDFVLLQWFINDFEGHDKSKRPRSFPLLPSYTLNKYLRGSSAFYSLANIQWQKMQGMFGSSGSYEKYMIQRFSDPESADSKIAVSQLTEFIDLCRKHNTPLGIVLYPEVIPEMDTEYRFGYLHDRVISLCKQKNIEYLDLREDISPYTKEKRECKKLYANRLDSHPSPLANRIAAASIMKKFGPIWLSRNSSPIPRKN